MHTLGRRGGPSVSSLPPIPPVVPDGGFESPVVGAGNFQASPVGSPWTWTPSASGQSGIAGNNSAFGPPNTAPEGVQVAFVQGQAAVSQSIVFTRAGSYRLQFFAAERASTGGGTKLVAVDGTTVDTLVGIGNVYVTLTSSAFTVTAGPHTISVTGQDSADKTMFLDLITVIL